MSNSIIVVRHAGAVVVRFDRPEIRSPLSVAVLGELAEIVEKAAVETTAPALIFTGTGDVFASGADLREIAAVTAVSARQFAKRGQDLMKKIAAYPAPTIAAINGFCFGGALDLGLACVRRIASPNASFAHPGADLGIMTGWGGTQRLPRLIGEGRALEMFLTAARVTADQALKIGLIDAIGEDPLYAALSEAGEHTDACHSL